MFVYEEDYNLDICWNKCLIALKKLDNYEFDGAIIFEGIEYVKYLNTKTNEYHRVKIEKGGKRVNLFSPAKIYIKFELL